jgi:uncharacterized membrane protein (UPF0127 family)
MNPLLALAKGVRKCLAPPPAAFEPPQQARNVTRGTMLAARLEKARTGAARRKGLLGRESLLPGEGLWIAPCESVHTFFMRFPIDLVYLDRKLQVRKVRHCVGAWPGPLKRRARSAETRWRWRQLLLRPKAASSPRNADRLTGSREWTQGQR